MKRRIGYKIAERKEYDSSQSVEKTRENVFRGCTNKLEEEAQEQRNLKDNNKPLQKIVDFAKNIRQRCTRKLWL